MLPNLDFELVVIDFRVTAGLQVQVVVANLKLVFSVQDFNLNFGLR